MNGISHPLTSAQKLAEPHARSEMLICPTCRTTYSSSRLSVCYRDGARLVDYERFVAVDRDPLRGAIIGGKYRLVERVGQGGMGTVYRAVQTGLNRAVAVKILKRELNVDPDTVARFHREANAMSLLAHPNTVRVYDFGQTDDGLLYLVMELLVGELITEKMAREGALNVLEALRMTQQILRSLAEAHSQAIVHRDLKPDNVFVARLEGHDEPVIKVLDFGIAKVVAPDRRVDQFETQAGTVFGTPRYMSPEQAQGNALDGRSDLYTVGTLLYQMLVGHAPFTDDDAVVVMAKHIRELPMQPVLAAPERPIPSSINDVVMRAIAKDPDDRYQDAAEFELALEACVPDVVAAQQAMLTGRWPRRPARHGSWLYGACALTLFGAGYLGVRVYAKHHAHAESFTAVPLISGSSSSQDEPSVPPEERAITTPLPFAMPHVREGQEAEPTPRAAEVGAVALPVRSVPSGATIYRAGHKLGDTPLTLTLADGEKSVRIELHLSGYQMQSVELSARDAGRVITLKPLRVAGKRRRPMADGAQVSFSAADVNPYDDDQEEITRVPPAQRPQPVTRQVSAATTPEPTRASPKPASPRGPYERFE